MSVFVWLKKGRISVFHHDYKIIFKVLFIEELTKDITKKFPVKLTMILHYNLFHRILFYVSEIHCLDKQND